MEPSHVNSADGTPLRLHHKGDSRRNILLVHGLAEHAGRYGHVVDALVAGGFRVTVVELRGHGRSGGQRGHVDRWRRYAEDMWAAARTAGEVYAIVAHSMGGLVALDALREALDPPLVGVALSNPLLGSRVKAPKVKVKLAGLLSRLVPSLPLSNELDARHISRDPDVVAKYQADPLVFGTITPRWYTEMVAAMARAPEAAARVTAPLLLQLGESDPICDPVRAAAVAERWGGPVTVKRYPSLYHEIFNEPEKEEVLADLVGWLKTLPWDKALADADARTR